jgi:hypothetical protein
MDNVEQINEILCILHIKSHMETTNEILSILGHSAGTNKY